MAADTDLHERVLDEIDHRIQSLRYDKHEDLGDTERASALDALTLDKRVLLAHWEIGGSDVGDAATPGEPTRSGACGQHQPCVHVRDLAVTYGLTPPPPT